MTVKELIKELLNHDLNSKVVIHANAYPDNRKITVIGDEIEDIFTGTGMSGTALTIIETKFDNK